MAWKTLENDHFSKPTQPAPFREEAIIFTIVEKAKTAPSFARSASCHIVSQARRNPPFYIRTAAKRTPIYGGPYKPPGRLQHGDISVYHPPQAAFLCRAVQRLERTLMGVKGRFPVLRIHTNDSGFLAPCGPATDKKRTGWLAPLGFLDLDFCLLV